ncbi:MAG: bifunctional phosphopantothenoylcysteine decarboxylase/phosphopantothenate--cysteine ligase CoaBC [Acidobacteria bacterium]|nr:MAG: bifunctional phosphopantothenoylcysteine decarboxylase/phosphopantothenate--cysteine ligase CoaBC [Acidobacteriota bacterium]
MSLICLGVSGGIGAYKAVEVARLLQKRGHEIQAVMTRSAKKFVGPLTFEAITRRPVISNQFAPGINSNVEHIAIASSAELLLVAPATANIIGKFANGIADDFLTSLHLATKAPVLMAPAMNVNMWEHPAVQENMQRLTARGVRFVDPGEGYLACGWIGKGRLAEPEAIAEAADRMLRPSKTLAGRRILVTAGPTYEDIDPVRYIGNRSSGRMGFAIAEAAAARGADVRLVSGPTNVPAPSGMGEIAHVRSAAEMHAAVMNWRDWADAIVMAAAVADYTPAQGARAEKIAKGGDVDLALARTRDILSDLGASRGDGKKPILVGFAAETSDAVDKAREKLFRKHADLIVANDVTKPGAGFDVETNEVVLVTAGGAEALPLLPKREVAAAILAKVEDLLR